MANNELTAKEQAALARAQADQNAFEAWAQREGVHVELAAMDECEDGRFPSTYHCREAETAWRAWANKPATPAQGELSDALPEGLVYAIERAINKARTPGGQHTNGPTYASLEVSQLEYVLRHCLRGQQGGGDAADSVRYRALFELDNHNLSVADIDECGTWLPTKESADATLDIAIQAQVGDAKGGA